MKLNEKVIEASINVRDQYYFIMSLEVKRKLGTLSPGEYEEAIERLKDLILTEDIENERFKQKIGSLSPEELFDNIFNEATDDDIETNEERSAAERLATKTKEDLFSKDGLIMGIEGFGNDIPQDLATDPEFREFLSRIKKDSIDYVEKTSLVHGKAEIDFRKNAYFFMMKDLEDENDMSVFFKGLLHLFINVYEDPKLEEDLIKCGFHPDKSWIMVDSVPGMSETEFAEYIGKRGELANRVASNTLTEILNKKWDASASSKAKIMFLKSVVRGATYLLDDENFEYYKEQFISLESDYHFADNKEGLAILKNIITEMEEDRKLYPKIGTQKVKINGEKLVKISSVVRGYYAKLAKLEIQKLNGEDTDFEYQRIIEAIKIAIPEELKEYAELIPKCTEIDPFSGITTTIAVSSKDQIVARRVSEKVLEVSNLGSVKRAITRKVGIPVSEEIRVDDNLELDLTKIILRNTLFFMNDSINKTDGKMREYLVKRKYDTICSSVILEQPLLDSNFNISESWIILPDNLGSNNEDGAISDSSMELNILKLIGTLLGTICEIDSRDKDLNGLICEKIAQIRGVLYTIDGICYENIISKLERLLAEPTTLQNPLVAAVISGAVNEAKQDRIKYQKLTFKAD